MLTVLIWLKERRTVSWWYPSYNFFGATTKPNRYTNSTCTKNTTWRKTVKTHQTYEMATFWSIRREIFRCPRRDELAYYLRLSHTNKAEWDKCEIFNSNYYSTTISSYLL